MAINSRKKSRTYRAVDYNVPPTFVLLPRSSVSRNSCHLFLSFSLSFHPVEHDLSWSLQHLLVSRFRSSVWVVDTDAQSRLENVIRRDGEVPTTGRRHDVCLIRGKLLEMFRVRDAVAGVVGSLLMDVREWQRSGWRERRGSRGGRRERMQIADRRLLSALGGNFSCRANNCCGVSSGRGWQGGL